MKLYENGVYLLNGTEIVEDTADVMQILAAKTGSFSGKDIEDGCVLTKSHLRSHKPQSVHMSISTSGYRKPKASAFMDMARCGQTA